MLIACHNIVLLTVYTVWISWSIQMSICSNRDRLLIAFDESGGVGCWLPSRFWGDGGASNQSTVCWRENSQVVGTFNQAFQRLADEIPTLPRLSKEYVMEINIHSPIDICQGSVLKFCKLLNKTYQPLLMLTDVNQRMLIVGLLEEFSNYFHKNMADIVFQIV